MTETSEQELKRRTPGRRVLALDALRGLAAFVVIWHHFRLCFVTSEPRWFLRPLFAGRSAVVLFFVLSGYVLSIPYWRGAQPAYGRYLLRRFFRIYVPYAAAALVALLVASHLLYSQLPLSWWFYKTWQTPLTHRLIAAQFFTIPTSGEINVAFWSLRYEMEMSIIFPLMCWTMLRLRGWGTLLGALVIEGTATVIFKIRPNSPLMYELAQTLLWGSCFVYGALLSWKSNLVGAIYSKAKLWMKVAILVPILVVYFSTRSSLHPFAACGVLIFAERSRVSRLLDTAIPEYLGRISYSMYLLHGTVLYATMILLYEHLSYGKMRIPFLALIYLLLTLAVSHIFCITVEEPSMRLGKRLTQRVSSTGAQRTPSTGVSRVREHA